MNKKNIKIGGLGDIYTNQVTLDITLENGMLSICGNIHKESAGQCKDYIREYVESGRFVPCEPYTVEKIKKLLDIWDAWHLNDMHPECEHQRALGWKDIACETRTIYHWRLKPEVSSRQSKLKEEAIERACSTESKSLGFSPEEKRIMKLEYSLKTSVPTLSGYELKYYDKPNSSITKHEEEIRLGWTNQEEHFEGILSKPCPVCGYKYGTKWNTVELPADVVDFITNF